jgi:uncharacterized protein
LPHLARITIYPVKSLDGVDVSEARILPGGALENDRRFAIVDGDGRYVNGKRTGKVHLIRSSYDPTHRILTLGLRRSPNDIEIRLDDPAERALLHELLSGHFSLPVTLEEAPETGFPDDSDSPGPTVIASATLDEVSSWFGLRDAEEIRERFRANLEIGGSEAFWDDRLYSIPGQAVRFRIGGIVLEGVNPCRRCVVPSRSPVSGEPFHGFQGRFLRKRRETLPPWAEASRFDQFYRLAVNTRLPDHVAGTVRVGDEVEILTLPNHCGPTHV